MIYCWLITVTITVTVTIEITPITTHVKKEQTPLTTTISTINRNILTITHMRYQDIHTTHLITIMMSIGTTTTRFGRIAIETI